MSLANWLFLQKPVKRQAFQSAIVTSSVMMTPTNNMTSPFLELSNETVLGDMVPHQRHSNLYYLLIPIPWLNLAVQMVFTRIIVGYLKSKPPLSQTGVLLLRKQLNDPGPGSLNNQVAKRDCLASCSHSLSLNMSQWIEIYWFCLRPLKI